MSSTGPRESQFVSVVGLESLSPRTFGSPTKSNVCKSFFTWKISWRRSEKRWNWFSSKLNHKRTIDKVCYKNNSSFMKIQSYLFKFMIRSSTIRNIPQPFSFVSFGGLGPDKICLICAPHKRKTHKISYKFVGNFKTNLIGFLGPGDTPCLLLLGIWLISLILPQIAGILILATSFWDWMSVRRKSISKCWNKSRSQNLTFKMFINEKRRCNIFLHKYGI